MLQSSPDAIMGCLVGGALGDAIGAAVEGQRTSRAFSELLSGPWTLTDDTQLTLATCEAITTAKRVAPETIAAAMLSWFRRGAVHGLGASTLKALRDLDAGIHWALAGRTGEQAAGNGAAMRIAPLAFVLDAASYEDRRTIRDVCRITHHSDEAYAGALAVIMAIQSIPFTQLPDTNVRDRILAYEALGSDATIADASGRFGNSGYVSASIPLAIFAADKCPALGFEGMLEQIISSGGDTDTNASLAGQIAGMRLGLIGLPAALIERLPEREVILQFSRAFAEGIRSCGRQ